ncbi:MAG TPA: 5'/3'-nucleotidase SurE [Candidatus Avidesulfovibrio excrementigallinarum]|nr:5'/3'-nucleotidase SurE [Candidatus Avidesulfovibrio excrementigallinarum]
MRIVLSNDDGIWAAGLRAMYRALKAAGHDVLPVAPLVEQSATSSRLTAFDPLRFKQIDEGDFHGIGIGGTPVDCVKIALTEFYATPDTKPDLIVSGINAGLNIGFDVLYSGTVAAAREGALMGIPALAVSRAMRKGCADDPEAVADHAAALIDAFDWKILPNRVLNVNYPPGFPQQSRGLRVCRLSPGPWRIRYVHDTDPRGRPYLWMSGDIIRHDQTTDQETDSPLLQEGFITVTPLTMDLTDNGLLSAVMDQFAGQQDRSGASDSQPQRP